jgi:hypothetical protein
MTSVAVNLGDPERTAETIHFPSDVSLGMSGARQPPARVRNSSNSDEYVSALNVG